MPEPVTPPPSTPGAPSRSWREIGADLVRPTRSQLVVAAVLLLCGLALTVQLAGADDQRYTTLRQD